MTLESIIAAIGRGFARGALEAWYAHQEKIHVAGGGDAASRALDLLERMRSQTGFDPAEGDTWEGDSVRPPDGPGSSSDP
jgi:hypothetical protein